MGSEESSIAENDENDENTRTTKPAGSCDLLTVARSECPIRQLRGRIWRPTKLKDPTETIVQLPSLPPFTPSLSSPHTESSSALRQESEAASHDEQRTTETGAVLMKGRS